jgi:hypothetical protein
MKAFSSIAAWGALVVASHAQSLVPSGWDPALAGDVVMQRLIKVTAPKVKGTHDAEFLSVGERAYVVTEANDLRTGESSAWPFIYVTMSIVNLKTLEVEKIIDFARGEQVFENETLPVGQCFVPRILQKDANTLRCYFTSQDPGKRQSQMWYIDFDLKRAEFENRISRAKLKTAAGTFDMQPQYFHADAAAKGFRRPPRDAGLFIFDSFKRFDGKIYVALNNFPVGQNALSVLHDDLVTFEVLGHYNEPQSQQLSESAVNRLPDGTWMAIVRNDKGNYHFTTSQDGRTWTVGREMPFVNGSNSKPTFDQFGGIYYLGWQDAALIGGQRRTIFNLDISRDGQTWERKYRFETPHSFQYPTFHEHEGAIWLSVTQGTQKDRIMFGKLEDVGQFESQAGRKRIEWPPTLPGELTSLTPGEKLFTDREYVADEIPAPVRGLPFLRTSIDKVDVETTKAGTMFVLTPTIRPKASSQEAPLQQAGFAKIEMPEVQLFPGEVNRVSLYRKEVKAGERLRFSKMVLLVFGPGAEVKLHEPAPPKPWTENAGEKLYNGIVLPQIWPPDHFDPKSDEPMPAPYLQHPPKVIPIDVGRQLFVDDFLIEETTLQRTFHTAKKFEGNPVFKPETKHEFAASTSDERGQEAVCYLGHGGVFFDPAAKHFAMFYTAGWRGPLAFATSTNLRDWIRPPMGIGEDNLLLAKGRDAGGDNSVWLDLASQDERIKFLTDRGRDGHQLQTSRDGRAWSEPVTTGRAADYCSFFHNPFRNVWCFSIKQGGPRGRSRWYHESADFRQGADWSSSVYWCNADRLDKPDAAVGDAPQLYSLSAVAYESVLLGEFQILLGPDNKICDQGKFPKTTEIKLGFSRDGFHWHRPDRRAFIPATRREGDWDRAYLHGTTGVCVVMEDQLWFPYCAYSGIAPSGTRGMYTGASIGLATLRRDGFASVDADAKGGALTTRPVVFKGSHLFVNVNVPNGELRVEVLDESGSIVAASKQFSVDKTKHLVAWEGAPDLAAIAGKAVRFRFHLSHGQLYAFWVSSDPNGASNGYLGAGGPEFAGVRDLPARQAAR